MDEALLRRVEQIERRLATIESQLQLHTQSPVAAHAESPATPPPLPDVKPVIPTRVAPIPVQQAVAPRQPIAYQAARAPDASQPTLEQTIGLKWAGWIGAVVLVIGAALGFKYAYDMGWLGNLPDPLKLAALSLTGFALIGAGEWVFRRVNSAAAAGLYGAGVAMLFVASYAGHAWYGLFAQNVAIGLSLASAVAGVVLAARADLVSIAVLAIVGGSIAPILISSAQPNVGGFLSYLLGLQLMALALCWWQAKGKWWVLRSVSLVTLLFWMPATVFGMDSESLHVTTLTLFAILFAVLYHGELILTTSRAHAFGRSTMAPAAGVIFSVLVTAAFVIWMLMIERDNTHVVRGMWVLGTAGVCAILGFILKARDAVFAAISQSLRVQAIMLIVLAVPVLLDGSNIIWGWVLLAVSLGLIGHFMKLPISLIGAACVWALAVAAWSGWQITRMGRSDWFTILGTDIEARVIMGIVLTVSGHLIAQILATPIMSFRLAVRERLEQFGAINQVAAASVLVVSSVMLAPVAGTILLIGYVWCCMIVSLAPRLRLLGYVALGAIIATAIKWLAVDIAEPLSRAVADPASAFANWRFICGIVITLTLFAQTLASKSQLRSALTIITAIVLLMVGSVELDHYARQQTAGPEWIVRQVGWSIFWAVCGVAFVILGFSSHNRVLRIFALSLLGLTLLKVTLIDLSGAGTGWRILSFIGLGGVLLGTSVLYGKFGAPKSESAKS